MPSLRVALPALLENETTAQEIVVATAVCRWLKELKIRCRVFRNPILYFDGKIYRPDIYIPALGLIIEVDGRAHERCDGRFLNQQRSDEVRDESYHEHMGVWVYPIPNWVAHNNFQLGMLIKGLLSDMDKKRPSRTQYNRTAKAITSSREQFQEDYPAEYAAMKSGDAGYQGGYRIQHAWGGFQTEIRPKADTKPVARQKKKGPSKKPSKRSVV